MNADWIDADEECEYSPAQVRLALWRLLCLKVNELRDDLVEEFMKDTYDQHKWLREPEQPRAAAEKDDLLAYHLQHGSNWAATFRKATEA